MIARPMTLERLEQLKRAESAVYFHIEETFRKGTYTKQEQQYFRRLIDLGNLQLEAAFSWFEYDLMRAPHEVDYLENAIVQWEHLPPAERPAITHEAVADRLANLRIEIRKKQAVVEEAKRGGYFWSIVPLLEFFDLPEEERACRSCYPLLPSFMRRAYLRMQTPKQTRPGLMSRWLGNIRRLRFAISDRGGEMEMERHDPRDYDSN